MVPETDSLHESSPEKEPPGRRLRAGGPPHIAISFEWQAEPPAPPRKKQLLQGGTGGFACRITFPQLVAEFYGAGYGYGFVFEQLLEDGFAYRLVGFYYGDGFEDSAFRGWGVLAA